MKQAQKIIRIGSLAIVFTFITLLGIYISFPHFYKRTDSPMPSEGVAAINQAIQTAVAGDKPEDDIKGLLAERNEAMKSSIKGNLILPQNYALSQQTRENIPGDIAYLLETEKTITGDLDRVEIDLTNGESVTEYKLEQPDGAISDVYFEKRENEVSSKKNITLTGVALDNLLFIPSSQVLPTLDESLAAPLNVVGNKNVLVLRANFQNNPTDQPYSETQVRDEILNNADSTKNYFTEQSYAKYTVATATVSTQWFTIPYSSTGACLTYYTTWGNSINHLAGLAGYNLNAYDNVLYLMAPSSGCTAAGIGSLPGDWTMFFGYNDSRVYSHELGHNIGAHHAASYDCGNSAIKTYTDCTMTEYGDYYDAMGSVWSTTKAIHFNAPHKYSMGWLGEANVATVTSNGRYTISNLETTAAGSQALRIYRPATDDYYYLEYRKPTGFDTSLSTWGYSQTGAIGHIWDDRNYEMTYLLDFQPVAGLAIDTDFKNASLLDGVPYVDSVNNITITQYSHDANTVTIDISSPATLDHFGSNSITTATAGLAFNVNLAAYDQYSALLTSFMGPVSITSSDAQAALPTDLGTGWEMSPGEATFPITLKTAGSQTVTFSSGAVSYALSVSVSPTALNHIYITPDTTQTLNVGEVRQFAATNQDVYHNAVSGAALTWANTGATGLFTAVTPMSYLVKASSGAIVSNVVSVIVTEPIIEPPVTPVALPIYQNIHRFWNTNGTHFYTASEAEKSNVLAKWPNIYRYEGVAYTINVNSPKQMTPLYRLWNSSGTHFYTASYTEAMDAVRKWPTKFRLEGVAYNVTMDPNGTTPVYRFWNTNGTHFYTASEAEKNNVLAKWPTIFQLEGVAYYLPN